MRGVGAGSHGHDHSQLFGWWRGGAWNLTPQQARDELNTVHSAY